MIYMNNLKPIDISKKVRELSGINVFVPSRKTEIVEMRSLLCYLLRDKLGMRWTNIARFFESQGKPINHATLIHSRKNYEMYKKTNKKIQEIEKLFSFKSTLTIDEIDRIHYLENKCKNLQLKFDHPLVQKLREVPEEKIDEVEKVIDTYIKSLEWKSKVL